MVGVKAGVGDELNRLRTDFGNFRDNLVGQLACTRIDNQRALRSDLDSDIGAISGEHVDITRNMKCMHVAVIWSWIGRPACLRRA